MDIVRNIEELLLALIAFVTAVISLVKTLSARKQIRAAERRLDASRVEIGKESSNMITRTPWLMWRDTPDAKGLPTTVYFGLRKRIQFAEPFSGTPEVVSSLSLLDIAGWREIADSLQLGADVLQRNGDPKLRNHVLTRAERITREGFDLRIGIGGPRDLADAIIGKLEERRPSSAKIEEAMSDGNLERKAAEKLTSDERWALNFYDVIGTIDASWVAQATARSG